MCVRLSFAILVSGLAMHCGAMPAAADTQGSADAVVDAPALEDAHPDLAPIADEGFPVDAAEEDVARADVPRVDAGPGSPAEVEAFFVRSCSSGVCHNAGSRTTRPEARMDLSPGAWFDSLVGQPSLQVTSMNLVEPGQPVASYLLNKLTGTMHTIPACSASRTLCGSRMPITGDLPTSAEIATVRAWIAFGAAAPSP